MTGDNGRPIDQIVVRKLGGWNLEPVSSWSDRSPDEQRDLVRQGRVKFLSRGVDVPLREALLSLRVDKPNGVPATTVKAAPVPDRPARASGRVAAPPASVVPSITIPLPGRSLPRARYRRALGEGKAWQVARVSQDGSEPLDGRWRRSADAYRWDSDNGLVLLAHDLACDSIDLSPQDAIPESLRTGLVSHALAPWLHRHHGNRPWEITAEEIRWWLHDHGFLMFVND